jgi:hypothetical protein
MTKQKKRDRLALSDLLRDGPGIWFGARLCHKLSQLPESFWDRLDADLPLAERQARAKLRAKLLFRYGTRPFKRFSGRRPVYDATRKQVQLALKHIPSDTPSVNLVSKVHRWLELNAGNLKHGVTVETRNKSVVRAHLRDLRRIGD